MGLSLVAHLETMFQRSQIGVGPYQAAVFFFGQQMGLMKPAQGRQGISFPNRREAAPENQLQGLDDKFDFPNPPGSEFDVVFGQQMGTGLLE